MVFCGNDANARGRPLGSRHRCFKKGVGVGIGIGEEKGEKVGKKKGIKHGKVIGEVKGRAKGIKIGKVALRLGHGLDINEVNSLKKDALRDIMLRRKRKNISTSTGAMSSKSKATLKVELLADLRRTHKLKE